MLQEKPEKKYYLFIFCHGQATREIRLFRNAAVHFEVEKLLGLRIERKWESSKHRGLRASFG